ncbi:hypothetical protein H4582DRAFT_2055759 [Lactarius indigo]|nr:hypothetical protein H4582DRAFT_2055759 [Lactarius indigo]
MCVAFARNKLLSVVRLSSCVTLSFDGGTTVQLDASVLDPRRTYEYLEIIRRTCSARPFLLTPFMTFWEQPMCLMPLMCFAVTFDWPTSSFISKHMGHMCFLHLSLITELASRYGHLHETMGTASSKSTPNLLRKPLAGIKWHLGDGGATIREARMHALPLTVSASQRPPKGDEIRHMLRDPQAPFCSSDGTRPRAALILALLVKTITPSGPSIATTGEPVRGYRSVSSLDPQSKCYNCEAERLIDCLVSMTPGSAVGEWSIRDLGVIAVVQSEDKAVACPIKDRCKGVQSNGWRLPTRKVESELNLCAHLGRGTSDIVEPVRRLIVLPAGEGGEVQWFTSSRENEIFL